MRARTPKTSRRRCPWAESDPLMTRYHDEEWGVPVHDDRLLFEFSDPRRGASRLKLANGLAQAGPLSRGLSIGLLQPGLRGYDARKVRALLGDPGIIRKPPAISATISNARAFLAVRQKFGSFDAYLWQFTGKERTKQNMLSARTKGCALPVRGIGRDEQGSADSADSTLRDQQSVMR